MSTLRRLLSGLVASGFLALPMAAATPAAAEPTPTPAGPLCEAGTWTMTTPSDIVVADAPGIWAKRSVTIHNTTDYAYNGRTVAFLGIELSFRQSSPVTTYSTKLTLTASDCGDTVLASSSAMRFGFMTSGPASASGGLVFWIRRTATADDEY